MWRTRMVIAAVMAAASGSAIAAFTANGSSSDPAVTQTATVAATAPASPAEVQAVDQQQARSFAVFGTAPNGQAGLPASVMQSSGITGAGGNRDLTRAVAASSGRELYVTPASGQVCLSDVLQNSCGSTDSASVGYMVELEACAPGLSHDHSRVFGLVPNGVTEVVIEGARATPASVTSNVYDIEVAGAPSGVSFTDGAGVGHTIPLGTPSGTCEAPSSASPGAGG